MQVQDAAALLKFAGFVTFVSLAVYAGIEIEELDRIEDDETLAYSLRFLGEALTYGGVLYGLGWAISLLNSLKGKGGTRVSSSDDSEIDTDEPWSSLTKEK
jgi:hypothetical protein